MFRIIARYGAQTTRHCLRRHPAAHSVRVFSLHNSRLNKLTQSLRQFSPLRQAKSQQVHSRRNFSGYFRSMFAVNLPNQSRNVLFGLLGTNLVVYGLWHTVNLVRTVLTVVLNITKCLHHCVNHSFMCADMYVICCCRDSCPSTF